MKFWTGFVTEHVRESKAFYLKLFGCNVVYEGDDDWFVLLELNGSELAFMKPAQESQAQPFAQPYSGQGAWIAVDVSDVDAHYARICEMGVPITVELRDEPWGDRHFVITDPNGIAVDVVERIQAEPA